MKTLTLLLLFVAAQCFGQPLIHGPGTTNYSVGFWASNTIFCDTLNGNDANNGLSWNTAVATPEAAVTATYQFSQPATIHFAKGTWLISLDNLASMEVTNIQLVGEGSDQTSLYFQTNGTGNPPGQVFDSFGSFSMRNMSLFVTNYFAQNALYPVLVHTRVGNLTNTIYLNDVRMAAISDDISSVGTTTGGKTYPNYYWVNSFLTNGFDTAAIGFSGFYMNGCHLEANGTFGSNGFGNGNTLHGLALAGNATAVAVIENSTINVRNGTNQYCLDVIDPNATIYLNNVSLAAYPAPFTVANYAITNESSSVITNNNVSYIGSVVNGSSGAIVWPGNTISAGVLTTGTNFANYGVFTNMQGNGFGLTNINLLKSISGANITTTYTQNTDGTTNAALTISGTLPNGVLPPNVLTNASTVPWTNNASINVISNAAALGTISNITPANTTFFTNNLKSRVELFGIVICVAGQTALGSASANASYKPTINGVGLQEDIGSVVTLGIAATNQQSFYMSDILGPGDFFQFSTSTTGNGSSVSFSQFHLKAF